MSFLETVGKARAFLERNGRVSLRALQREFELDDEVLDELVEELVDVQQIAAHEGKVLSWIGAVPAKPSAPEPKARAIFEASSEPAEASQAAEAERRQLTVMFCDLVDSTRLAYQLDPEDWREVVRQYQETCSDAVERFDGHVAQYLGDGVLVYFGYPFAHEDDAIRTLHAALQIPDEVRALNGRLAEHQPLLVEHPLQVRLGVHTGAVVVGTVGAGEKRDQLALGETTHIAARLEALAKPGTVVLSDATRQLVRGAFLLADLGEQSLKGVSRPVSAFRAVRTLGVHSRLDFGSGPLVGREQQMALLMERWQEAREGRGQVVLLSGEAGMGKSRLVQALRERVADQPHTWHEYHCSRYHQSSAFFPVGELIERVLVFTENDTPDARIEKLARGLHWSRLPVPEILPLIAPLLSLPATDAFPPSALNPETQRRKTLQVLSAWCLAVADPQPLILIAEDLHWADPTTLELVGMVVDQAPTASILMVMTYRPGFQAPWASRSHTVHFTLNALSRRQVRQMVDGLAGGKALPAEVMAEVVSKTDGVPLFVEELTKMVIESGLLHVRDGSYELAGPLPPLAIPTTLQDSLMARLDRLGSTKEVVQLGAVLGREFSHELLATVSSLDPQTLEGALDQLVGAELLYQRGARPHAAYTFKHTLIQETAYQSLLKSTRQQYHARIAQALVQHSPETAENQPELIAHHYTESRLLESAIDYLERAGKRDSQRSAHREAAGHLRKALTLLDQLPASAERDERELRLHAVLGVSLQASEGFSSPVAHSCYERVRELCDLVEDFSHMAFALWGSFSFHITKADLPAARHLAEDLYRFGIERDDPMAELTGHVALGNAAFYEGNFSKSLQHIDAAIGLYRPAWAKEFVSHYVQDFGSTAQCIAAWTLWSLGLVDAAAERARLALAHAKSVGHPFTIAYTLAFAGAVETMRRMGERASSLAEEAITVSDQHGFPLWLGVGRIIRGWCRAGQEGALEQMQEGIAIAGSTGNQAAVTLILGSLAETQMAADMRSEALHTLEGALGISHKNGTHFWDAELHRLKGEIILQRSDQTDDEARTLFRKAIEIARRQEAKALELRAAMSLARLWQRQGKRDEARDILAPVYAWFTEGFDTTDLRDAKALLEALA